MKLPQLNNYYDSVQSITDYFVKKYFGKDVSDVYWIADDIGGVLAVNDYFFSLTDMVDFLKYGYKTQEMFDYYDYSLKFCQRVKIPINIKNWRELKD